MSRVRKAMRQVLTKSNISLPELRQQTESSLAEVKKERIREIGLLSVFLLLFIFAFFFISPSFTGFMAGEQTESYTDDISEIFEASGQITWSPDPTIEGELSSIRISGRIIGEGTAKVYFEDRLVYESKPESEPDASLITGMLIDVPESVPEAEAIIQAPPENPTETQPDGQTAEQPTQEVEEQPLPPEELAVGNTTPLAEIGLNSTPADIEAALNLSEADESSLPLVENISEQQETPSTEEQPEAASAEPSEEPKEPDAQISPGPKISELVNECVDTCILSGYNSTSYKIRVELENARLEIDSIGFTMKTEIISGEPAFIPFADTILYEGMSKTINLSEHFLDPDGDVLTYMVVSGDNLITYVEYDQLTIMPLSGFIGESYIIIYASDGTSTTISPDINITVVSKEYFPPEIYSPIPKIFIPPGSSYTLSLNEYFVGEHWGSLNYSILKSENLDAEIENDHLILKASGEFVGVGYVNISMVDIDGQSLTYVIPAKVGNSLPYKIGNASTALLHVGGTTTIDLGEYFTDPDGDNLIYLFQPIENLTIEIIGDNLTITQPVPSFDEYDLNISISDGLGPVANHLLKVIFTNEPPRQIADIPDMSMNLNTQLMFNLTGYFMDPDNDPVVYAAYSPALPEILISESRFTFPPQNEVLGNISVFVYAEDQFNRSPTVEFTLEILPALEIIEYELDEPVPQSEIIVGQPVKWTQRVAVKNNKTEANNISITVGLPISADNISVLDRSKNKELEKDKILVPSLEKTLRRVEVEKAERSKKPKEPSNSQNLVTGNLVLAQEGEGVLARLINWLAEGSVTGRLVDVPEQETTAASEEAIPRIPEILFTEELAENESKEYIVEYYTDGPFLAEFDEFGKKTVQLSSDIDYQGIITFTEIEELPQESIRLYWLASREDYITYFLGNLSPEEPLSETTYRVDVTDNPLLNVVFQDTNNNGLIDRLEWITPHLSDQTFEITFTVLNPYSYLRDGENWTVYFNTSGIANLTISSPNANWTELLLDSNETFDEMKLEEIACGNTSLKPALMVIAANGSVYGYEELGEDDSIKPAAYYLADYSCDNQTSYIKNYMIKAGYATLLFEYSNHYYNITDYAYDPEPFQITLASYTSAGAIVNRTSCTMINDSGAGYTCVGGGDPNITNLDDNCAVEGDYYIRVNTSEKNGDYLTCGSSCAYNLPPGSWSDVVAGDYNESSRKTHTVSWDGSSANCSCKMGSTAYWNIGGEVSGTTCCGDDAGEYNKTEEAYSSSIGFDNNENACCNEANDCVSGSTCYKGYGNRSLNDGQYIGLNVTGNDTKAVCYNTSGGEWLDCDQAGFMNTWCANITGGMCGKPYEGTGNNSVCFDSEGGVLSGETFSFGEYTSFGQCGCCGDDTGENYHYLLCHSSVSATNTSDDACCSSATDCVYNATCYASGSTATDIDSNGENDFCFSTTWYDCNTDSECPSNSTCVSNDCVLQSPVIYSHTEVPNKTFYNSPTYGPSVYITANVSNGSSSTLISVNFTLTNPAGTKVINNINGTRSGNIWNSGSYSINAYGQWNYTIVAWGANGYNDTETGTINFLQITESLNSSVVKPESLVRISGHINDSQWQNVSDAPISIYVGGVLLYDYNFTEFRQLTQLNITDLNFESAGSLTGFAVHDNDWAETQGGCDSGTYCANVTGQYDNANLTYQADLYGYDACYVNWRYYKESLDSTAEEVFFRVAGIQVWTVNSTTAPNAQWASGPITGQSVTAARNVTFNGQNWINLTSDIPGSPGTLVNLNFRIFASGTADYFRVDNINLTCLNVSSVTTDANGNYNYTFTAPTSAGTYEVKVNASYNGEYGEVNTTLVVTELPDINSHTEVPAKTFWNSPTYGTPVYITANATGTNLIAVNFTLTAPNGTKVINNRNASSHVGDIWNSSSFSLNAYGEWSYTVAAIGSNGYNDTKAGTINFLQITETLNSSLVRPGYSVRISGHINDSQWTSVPNTSIEIYVDGTNLEGQRIWEENYTGAGRDKIHMMTVDSSGNLYTSGYAYYAISSTSDPDWWLKKYDINNVEDTTNWNKTFDAKGYTDYPCTPLIDSLGDIYFVGMATNLTSVNSYQDWWIKKFNSTTGVEYTKAQGWDKNFSSPGITIDVARDAVIDSNDNIYVVGVGGNLSTGTGRNWWIKKFNRTGYEYTKAQGWDKNLTGPGGTTDDAFAVALDSQGNVYVAGYGVDLSGTTGQDWWIKKFSSSGTEDTADWNINISSAGDHSDQIYDIAISSDDMIYAVGHGTNLTSTNSYYDWWIKKFNSTGYEYTSAEGWNKNYSGRGTSNDAALAVVVDSQGNVYVAGEAENIAGASTGLDWWIKKFSSSGVEDTVYWNKTYTGPGEYEDSAGAIIVTNTNRVYVAGYGSNLTVSDTDYDSWIMAFTHTATDANGDYNYSFTAPSSVGVYEVKVNATYNGEYGEKNTTLLVNSVSTIQLLNISPAAPNTTANLNCNITVEDSDNTTLNVEFTWYNGATPVVWGNNTATAGVNKVISTLGGANTTKGESWSCYARASDGISWTDYSSATVSIFNEPPNIALSNITSSPAGYYDNGILLGWCNATDADLDGVSYSWKWFRNGVLNSSVNSSHYLVWDETVGGISGDNGEAVSVDSNGNVYALGYTQSFDLGGGDFWLLKYNSTGSQLWNTTAGGTGIDWPMDMVVDHSDNIYVTGYTASFGAGSNDIWLLKYNSTGSQLWNRTIGGVGPDHGYSIAMNDSNNIYVTGYTPESGSAGGDDVWILKFNNTGGLLWNRTVGFSEEDYGTGIAVDAGGNPYVVGTYVTDNSYVWLLKYNSTGSQLWNSTIGLKNDDDSGYYVSVDTNGDAYIGGSDRGNAFDPWLWKYSSNGIHLWNASFEGDSDDYGKDITLDTSGNIYMAGTIEGLVWLMKYKLEFTASGLVNVANITSGLEVGQNWTLECTAYDYTNYSAARNSTMITIQQSNVLPTHDQPYITPASPNTTSDLLCNWNNVQDEDGNPVQNITNWYRNDVSITALYMPFEGGSNSTYTKDYSGHGNSGVVSEAVWSISSGKIRGGYSFDGYDDYIDLGDNYDLEGSNFTVCAWAYPTDINNGYLLGKFDVSTNKGFWLRRENNVNWSSGTETGEGMIGIGDVETDTWQHLCVVINPSPGRSALYKNGVEIASSTGVAATVDNSRSMMIGNRYDNGRPFEGGIDEVKIFTYSISPKQVLAEYEAGLFGHSNNQLLSEETYSTEEWLCEVTPNDGYGDGITKNSTAVTIQNSPPYKVNLSYPADKDYTFTNRTPRFNWSITPDADGDTVTYHLEVSLTSTFTDQSINVTGISNNYYVPTDELNVYATYWWRVHASDGTDDGSFSDTWNFTIVGSPSITLTDDIVNFGNLQIGTSNDTSDNSPLPFYIENDGNIAVNISVNASALWQSTYAPLGTSYYQYKANSTSEGTAYNSTYSLTSWQNMTATLTRFAVKLNHSDAKDLMAFDIRVVVPLDEPAVQKNSSLLFVAVETT